MPKQAIEEPFSLTKGETGITSTDGLNASTSYGEIWKYQVPIGIGLIILPGHTFSCYLEGDDDAEMPATTLIRVSYQDVALQEKKPILGPIMYQTVKEFTDRTKIAKVNVPEPIKLYEQYNLIVEAAGADATGTGGVDQTGGSSDSFFDMEIMRVRQPL